MAETADILANRPERLAERCGERVTVILPDMAAGCSMADMAMIDQVENCWSELGEVIDTDDITPVTYVNSAASLKAFCGKHGGIVCTSSNAAAVLERAFRRTKRVLFFPDQHLGRNTALRMGIGIDEMPVWNPHAEALGGNREEALKQSRVVLWQGHCSVHQMFRTEHVDQFRAKYPGIKILVHPECTREVVDNADISGSTGKIIREVETAPAGTRWAIGTELHLVNRLKQEHPRTRDSLPVPRRVHVAPQCIALIWRTCAGAWRIWRPDRLSTLSRSTPRHRAGAMVALERMLEVK